MNIEIWYLSGNRLHEINLVARDEPRHVNLLYMCTATIYD